ncbi:hypothetical protein IEE83_18185 [Dyadobacter sp. UP-52]|uniref:Uncharacterized protein n=1 Tax=Dyadobacter subterraneus TaxID=2773304 RepID=A0ABR9WFW4_9BACT|nr:hypothetical protein [Dyadobacter subterraneus]
MFREAQVDPVNHHFPGNALNETISEWAMWKENTCYVYQANPDFQIKIQAGER